MSIVVKITGNDTIHITDSSVVQFENCIGSFSEKQHVAGQSNTVKLIGTVDLNLQREETKEVMKLGEWALKPSTDSDCYREVKIYLYDSEGNLLQNIHFEKCFIVEYEDRFTSTQGRASYTVVLRQLTERI